MYTIKNAIHLVIVQVINLDAPMATHPVKAGGNLRTAHCV